MIDRVIVGGLQTNCFIVPLPKNDAPQNGSTRQADCMVVDPGAESELILARLEELQLRPRYIVLTHAHFDHVSALPNLAAAFPDADIAVHQAEAGKLGPGSLEFHQRDISNVFAIAFAKNQPALLELYRSLPEATLLLNEGDTLGPFHVLHLPGHSPGSIGLYREEENILFSGDTLFRHGIGRTDLPGGNEALLFQSLKRLFSLDADTVVYPGHAPATTIGKEQ